MTEYRIYFPKYKQEVFALSGTSLYECLSRAEIRVKNPCAGQGKCGKCRVKVVFGYVPPSEECKKIFSLEELDNGWRLACKTHVNEDLVIEIPEESVPEEGIIILAADEKEEVYELNPFVEKKCFQLRPPVLENPVSDLDAMRSALGNFETDVDLLQKIPEFLRKNDFSGTVVFYNSREKKIISLESGDTKSANFAIAIDLGTTTIVATLLDMNSGKRLGSRGMLNPQVRFGDDVLSRISSQNKSLKNLRHLQKDAIWACNSLINELCNDFEIHNDSIYSVSIAGNTVMECLFCGISVRALGEIPFAPPFRSPLFIKAFELGLSVNPRVPVYIFPVIGGFVGGDIVSGITASRLNERTEPTLFVDVGTNGEIVLLYNGKLYATSAAAGPAFEGAGIESGMRASAGAIEKVIIRNGEVLINVIKNVEPAGICGSALIDAAAEMLRVGILDESGRILNTGMPDCEIRRRLRPAKDGGCFDFLLSPFDSKKKIFLRQKDIRELQLASGAIRAATNILLKRVGIGAGKLDSVLIAGGFGNFIRRSHAKRIGLIPNVPDSQIRFIGNSSLEGAKAVLFSRERMRCAEEIAKRVHYVEVSLDPEFQTEFASAMLFPSQDQFQG